MTVLGTGLKSVQCPPRQMVVGVVAVLIVALSAMGCDPPAAGEAGPRPPAGAEADRTRTPQAEATEVTPRPVRQEASPTPRREEVVDVLVTRPPEEIVEVNGTGTVCSPEWDRPKWLFRDFVQWSLDGSTVLFTGGPQIYAVTADGTRLWNVVVPKPPEGKQAWTMAPFTISPDGKEVIFATCEFGRSYELARVGVDGTQPQQLTTNTRSEYHPAWSPDGRRIAYLAAAQVRGGASELRPRLYTMAPDGSDARPVRMAAGVELLHLFPEWSPDSKHLAYAQREVRGRVGLYIAAVDGESSPRRLSETVSGPSWSPDGQRLAFAKPDGDEVALYTIAADGTDAQRVTTVIGWRPQYGEPDPTHAWIETVAWSPDGRLILYACEPEMCVVDVDGPLVGRTSVTQTIRLNGPLAAAWSPDSTRIAIVASPGFPVTVAPDGSDLRDLFARDAEGRFQSPDDLRQAEIAACGAGTAVSEPAANPDLVRTCETLLRARDALGGTSRLNWTSNRPLGEWEGLHLGGWPRRLTAITLKRFGGLTGEIPRALGELTSLRRLALSGHRLGGAIPPELGQLTQLARLDLSDNSLTGGIPRELGGLTRLVALQLANNQLTGPIPPELGQLANLETLHLGGNDLTGCIPPALHRVPDNDLAELGLPDCEPA